MKKRNQHAKQKARKEKNELEKGEEEGEKTKDSILMEIWQNSLNI